MVKMSPLQGSGIEIVHTRCEGAIIGICELDDVRGEPHNSGSRTEQYTMPRAARRAPIVISALRARANLGALLRQMEMRSGDSAAGREQLTALGEDATAKGFSLIARQTGVAMHE